MFKKQFTLLCAILIAVTTVNPLIALDTTEPFDIGFTDNEMYAGFSGAGLGQGERGLAWEHLIGVGITDRFSSMFFYSLESNEYLANKVGEVGAGLFFTILDKEIFDLDVMASITSQGALGIATELNLDFSKMGIQLTIEEGIENNGSNENQLLFNTVLAPLFYFSLTESFQLLTALDFAFFHNGDDAGTTEIGGAGLGLNVGVNEAIELITEVNFDIPQEEEQFSTGFSVGFIATLPWTK